MSRSLRDLPAAEVGKATAAVVGVFALVTIYFTGVFPPHPNVNEVSRLQAVVAFVERGTFAIDEELREFAQHEDKSVFAGHYYSNKAPGLAFAAIPVYRALRVVLPKPATGTSLIFVLVRLLTVSLVCVLALWQFGRMIRAAPGGAAAAAIVTAAVALGTPMLLYARTFFSHAWTASLIFLAFERLRAGEERRGERAGAGILAGLFAGWAAISEYPVFLLLPLFALRALTGWRWRRMLAFSAGVAIPVALLLLYNDACFGSPWTLSSTREAHPQFADLAGRGLLGIGMPSPRILASYLFHPNRGVVLASPFLLWSAAGFFLWWRSGRARADCALCLGVIVVFLIALSGYPNWEGGWALGSRYLVPILLLAGLAIPWAMAGRLSRGLFVAASVFALALHLLLTASYPYVPPSIPWPAATASAWFLARGFVAPNLGTLAGLPPLPSLLAPVLLVAAGLWCALRPIPATTPPRGAAALLGLLVFAASLMVPIPLRDWDSSWREGILRLFVAP